MASPARMAGVAGVGELLVSEPVPSAVGVDLAELERPDVSLKGKSAPLGFWVESPATVPT